jgi:signal transduction histidine kinase
VRSAVGLLRRAAEKKGVRLEIPDAVEPTGLCAAMDENAFKQVLINLLMNAIEAAPEGGSVRLRAAAEGRRLRLTVEDDGPGVPRELRSRIFEPFFTTRADGSGLGLAISHQLVRAAGGGLELEDRNGRGGACFVVTLPQARAARVTSTAPEPSEVHERRL